MQNGTELQVTSGANLRKQSRHLVQCPETGNVYLMRRPNLTDLIGCGVLPENFVAQTLQVLGKEQSTSDKLTDADLLKGEAMMRATLTASMLKPRIVPIVSEDDDDDVTEFYDIPPSDRQHLFLWAKGELPEVPLATKSGESVTVGAVSNFPVPEAGGEPSGVSDNSEQSGQESVGDSRAA